MPAISERLQKLEAILLGKRLAARHANVPGTQLGDTIEDRRKLPPLPALKRVRGIAVLAAERTARQTNERSGDPRGVGFALQGIEDFSDLESRHCPLEPVSR
jgi:hypothetical protein